MSCAACGRPARARLRVVRLRRGRVEGEAEVPLCELCLGVW